MMNPRRDLSIVLAVAIGLLMTLLVLPTPDPEPPASGFVIANVTLFDGERFHDNADVRVEGGRIRELGPTLDVPPGFELIDGAGGTLLPGLIDAHTHVFGDALSQALRFGVTTELDMFSPVTQVQMARRTRAGLDRQTGADLFSAGTLITAKGGHGTEYGLPIPTLDSAGQADAFVADRLEEGSDFIKVIFDDGNAFGIDWPTLDEGTLQAVVKATHSRGVKVVVHVSTLDQAKVVARAGADGLVHLFADQPVDREFVDLALDSGLFIVPTLSVLESVAGTGDGWFEDKRVLAHLDPVQRQSLRSAFPVQMEGVAKVSAGNLQTLHAAGVPMLAGTDAPNPGTAHGVSLHRELFLMVQAGMSVAEALRSATSLPGRYFPVGKRGRIEAGARADLLLVSGDVRADIGNSLNIRAVWKNGFAVDVEQDGVTEGSSHKEMQAGLVSDFDLDLDAEIGLGWQITTDGIRGGSSRAEQSWVATGNAGSPGSLSIGGEVAPGFAWPWAGTVYFPGERPMQPVRFQADHRLSFAVRGDGSTYHLLFLSDTGAPPVRYPFVAEDDWGTVSVSLTEVPGLDPSAIAGIGFAAGPESGSFSFQLDDVAIQ